MKQPDKCPNEIYEIMKQCWDMDPEQRPKFKEITKKILELSKYEPDPETPQESFQKSQNEYEYTLE